MDSNKSEIIPIYPSSNQCITFIVGKVLIIRNKLFYQRPTRLTLVAAQKETHLTLPTFMLNQPQRTPLTCSKPPAILIPHLNLERILTRPTQTLISFTHETLTHNLSIQNTSVMYPSGTLWPKDTPQPMIRIHWLSPFWMFTITKAVGAHDRQILDTDEKNQWKSGLRLRETNYAQPYGLYRGVKRNGGW